MSEQISAEVKSRRLHELEQICKTNTESLLNEELQKNKIRTVLFENFENGRAFGHTDDFLEVCVQTPVDLRSELIGVEFISTDKSIILGKIAN